ncbi:MAG: YbdD/YjiX family protein [Methylococcaceae bacterium]
MNTPTTPKPLQVRAFRVFLSRLTILWSWLRQLSGDDAYERYLSHRQVHHSHDPNPPLSRPAFFRSEQDRHWNNGIKRCC